MSSLSGGRLSIYCTAIHQTWGQFDHKCHTLTDPNYYTSAVSSVHNFLHCRGHKGNRVAMLTHFDRALRIYLLYFEQEKILYNKYVKFRLTEIICYPCNFIAVFIFYSHVTLFLQQNFIGSAWFSLVMFQFTYRHCHSGVQTKILTPCCQRCGL